jgi:membrane-associated phospholipid phosphatase
MQRLALALTFVAVASRPAAGQQPYRVSWWDAASIAAATALGVIPETAHLPHGVPPCAPCDPSSLPRVDHAALHTFSGPAGTASTVLLAGVAGLAGLASRAGAPAGGLRGHLAVFANSVAATFATTEWVKVLVHRSRPVLYTAAAPAASSDPDNRRSFPSGHAAVAFAVATSYVVLAGRERLPHRTRHALLLYAGAVGVAALRVAAGQHFPTDVAGGAALGTGIGWLVATVHPVVR